MNGLKIVIIGGGSKGWVPRLGRDMLMTPSIAAAQYVLLDIDKAAARLNKAFLDKVAARLGVSPRIVATDRQSAALDGADYIIITISTGGLDAMAHDLAIPRRYGIYHTVGDTSGPGGWARIIRNFDVFLKLARAFKRLAPRAVVLNYTNPMATLTDVLCREFHGPVVGLCHGVFENLEFIKRLYNLAGEDQIAAQYGGLNHFFWITHARAGKIDVIADLERRLRRQSFTQLLRDVLKDPAGWHSDREVATELFRLTGAMPYLGDRHTCEFFPWYITSPQNVKRYKLARTTIAHRRSGMRRQDQWIRRMLKDGIGDDFLHRSRETAADIIDAHSAGRVFIDVGNLPNTGQICSLPRGAVVETAVRVDRNGFTPLVFGPLPGAVQGFVEPYARVYTMTVDACFARQRDAAMQALRLDPLCARLTGAQVRRMGEQLLGAHRNYISAF